MARHTTEDDWDDDDEPSWDDSGDDSDDDTIPCPYCRREIHEDAERCPYCERYLSDEDAPATRKPWWVIVGAILCLYAMLRWMIG
ncbi:MAG: zinc ribbon domain-containing protein [Planctomycetota bacterium]